MATSVIQEAVREFAHPLTGARDDYDALLARIGDSRLVLLGEATHGTHEFHQARATLTKRLIREKGFLAVAIDGDWPDAYRVNRYVRGLGHDPDAAAALGSFRRFPAWMWRNADVLDFVGWLREHNAEPHTHAVGFYGLDVHGFRAAMETVLRHVAEVDPGAAERARQRYGAFDQFEHDAHRSGFLTGLGLAPSLQREIVEHLVAMTARGTERDAETMADAEDRFALEQNARLVKSAEEYYRTMFHGTASSWNLRDSDMVATLDELVSHLEQSGDRAAKVVVWAHNVHVGDARRTARSALGEHSLGQLVRERYGADAVLVGLTTYQGTVTAAPDWNAPAEHMRVRPALAASFESLLHAAAFERSLLIFQPHAQATSLLRHRRLERAIGVVYHPEMERRCHYFEAQLSEQFDALVHFDQTRAVEPLERTSRWLRGRNEETPATPV